MERDGPVRKMAIAMAAGRVAFGLGLAFAPRLTAVTWVGRDARKTGTQVLTRATGGRDLALGGGALVALLRHQDPRPWIGAQAAADLTDFVATAVAGDDLPPSGRRGVLALAGVATAAGLATLVAAGNGDGDSGDVQ